MWIPSNFLSLPPEQSDLNRARVVVLPVPYDSTASFKTGAREGPRAIIDASSHLEDYDPELDVDVAEIRIHTAPFIEPNMEGPARMISRVKDAVQPFICEIEIPLCINGDSCTPDVFSGGVPVFADLAHQLLISDHWSYGELADPGANDHLIPGDVKGHLATPV